MNVEIFWMLFRSPKEPLNILRTLTTGKIVTLLNYGSNDLEKERKTDINHKYVGYTMTEEDKEYRLCLLCGTCTEKIYYLISSTLQNWYLYVRF